MRHMKKLEIGPGRKRLDDDWITLDCRRRHHVDIVWDITNLPIPMESQSFDLIYMSHVLEHIPWTQTVDVLKDLHRILRPEGRLEVWVPDLEKLVQAYIDPDLISKDGWYKYNPQKDPTRWFNGRLFTYGETCGNWHRAAFDRHYLNRCLLSAGYSDTDTLDKPRGYDHGWINLGMVAVK